MRFTRSGLVVSILAFACVCGVGLAVFGSFFPSWKLRKMGEALKKASVLTSSQRGDCRPHQIFGDLHCADKVVAAWNLPLEEKRRRCRLPAAPQSLAEASAVNHCGEANHCDEECLGVGVEGSRLSVTLFSLTQANGSVQTGNRSVVVQALRPVVFQQSVIKSNFTLHLTKDTLEYLQKTTVELAPHQEARLAERVLLPNVPMHAELLGGRRRGRVGELALTVAAFSAVATLPSPALDATFPFLTAEQKTAFKTVAGLVATANEAELKKKLAGGLVSGCALAGGATAPALLDVKTTCEQLVRVCVGLGRKALAAAKPELVAKYGSTGAEFEWPWFVNLTLAEVVAGSFVDPVLNQNVAFLGALAPAAPERVVVKAGSGEALVYRNVTAFCVGEEACETVEGVADLRRLGGDFFSTVPAVESARVFIAELMKAAEFRKSSERWEDGVKVEVWNISGLEPRVGDCGDSATNQSITANLDCNSPYNTLDLGLLTSPDYRRVKTPIFASYPFFQNVTSPRKIGNHSAPIGTVRFEGEGVDTDAVSHLLVEPVTGRVVAGRQTMQVNAKVDEQLLPLFVLTKTAHATKSQMEKLIRVQDIPDKVNSIGTVLVICGSALAAVSGLAVLWLLQRKRKAASY